MFPGDSASKESTCNAGDLGLITGLGRSPGEGKGYPLQYSGLENSMDCIVHGVAKSRIQLSNFHFLFTFCVTYNFVSYLKKMIIRVAALLSKSLCRHFISLFIYFLAVPPGTWGISSLTRDRTRTPSTESKPLDHQGNPPDAILNGCAMSHRLQTQSLKPSLPCWWTLWFISLFQKCWTSLGLNLCVHIRGSLLEPLWLSV